MTEKKNYTPDQMEDAKKLAKAIPTMVGSQERVYGIVEPDIYDDLMANIKTEIGKVLSKR